MARRLATMIRRAALTPFRMGISWDVPFGVAFFANAGCDKYREQIADRRVRLNWTVASEESSPMAGYRRLEVTEVGDVTVVRFRDQKILDDLNIQELGRELSGLVEVEGRKSLLLNFSAVEFLSSAALGKLITLDKKVKAVSGALKLCHIQPEIYEVFSITKLNRLFDIRETEADALAAF